MSPYQLGILLHYYTRADDYPDVISPPPIWRETIDGFKRDDLLKDSRNEADASYEITQRGRVFVEGLCNLPLPVWRMP